MFEPDASNSGKSDNDDERNSLQDDITCKYIHTIYCTSFSSDC